MRKKSKFYKHILYSILGFCIAQSAYAGRPLVVDDANVNDTGTGHVELWYEHHDLDGGVWSIAPAYSPVEAFEIGATFSREMNEELAVSAIQGKWRITPSMPHGCNFGMSAGISHTSGGAGYAPFMNGLATCNSNAGSLHMNAGLAKQEGESKVFNWGLAYERDLGSATAAHIEWFGEEHSSPSVQVGLRHDLAEGLQLDGTVGRNRDARIYSIGIKKTF